MKQILTGLALTAGQYDGIILDVWGVLHDGSKPYPGAVDCFKKLQAAGKKIIILSNAARPASTVAATLSMMGYPIQESQIVTSGEVVMTHLLDATTEFVKTYGAQAFHLGDDNHPLLRKFPIALVPTVAKAGYILCTLAFPMTTAIESFDPILQEGIAHGLPLVCANPDKVAQNGAGGFHYCAGSLAERYEKLGGKVYYFGKPHESAYEAVRAQFVQMGLRPDARILAIGDTLETDILGAHQQGYDTLFVLCGVDGIKIRQSTNPETCFQTMCKKAGAKPTWIMEELRW